MDVTLFLIFICMSFLVKKEHPQDLWNMSDYQLPINMFIFILVNKDSTHKIPSLTGVFFVCVCHVTISYFLITITFSKNVKAYTSWKQRFYLYHHVQYNCS